MRRRLDTDVEKGASVADLEALYRRRYRYFLRVARLISGDGTRAHDAVQDGFAEALKGRQSYRGTGTLEAWVWRAVVHASTRHRRGDELPLPNDEPLPTTNSSVMAEDRTLRVWIATLSERQRLAVFLRYYADLDYRQIAEALAIEPGTVGATLNHAHAAMRRALEEVPG
jgi:RNA polymerase sigma-70 factor, ECF subfamily